MGVDAEGSGTIERYILHYYIRLCIVVMFHIQRFERHTCIVIEGFGALEMHLLLSSCLMITVFMGYNIAQYKMRPVYLLSSAVCIGYICEGHIYYVIELL